MSKGRGRSKVGNHKLCGGPAPPTSPWAPPLFRPGEFLRVPEFRCIPEFVGLGLPCWNPCGKASRVKEAELRGLRSAELSTLSSWVSERVPKEDQPMAFPTDSPGGSFRSTNVLASCFSFRSSPIPSPHGVPSLARSRSPPPLLGARPRPPPPFLCLKVYLQQKGAES